MTKYADDAATEAAKKAYEEQKKGSDKSRAMTGEKLKGKPTPTQEENDMVMLGAHILEHEADGSDLDVNVLGSVPTSNPGSHETKPAPQSYQSRHTAHKAE